MQNEIEFNGSFKSALSHVIWIGGATDAGKTTVTDALAEKYQYEVYHFDYEELRHIERLAETRIQGLHLHEVDGALQ